MIDNLKGPEFLRELGEAGERLQIFKFALILNPQAVRLGDGVRIDDYARVEGGTGVRIHRFVHIASYASILGGGSAEIGEFSGLAQGARLVNGAGHPFSSEFPTSPPSGDPFSRSRSHVSVGRYCLLGVNAVVLPGVTLGDGAIAAAGSVVTSDVDPWCVVAGAPARVISERERFAE